MPAIWTAELLTVTVVDFTEVCHFIGGEGVFENDITVLPEMWKECLEGVCRLGVDYSFFLSEMVCEELSVANQITRASSPAPG